MSGEDPGPINGANATVEHVLPRRPGKGTGWDKDYTSKAKIDEHVHRLGNLAVLTFEDNQKAGSDSFEKKKKIFAKSDFAMAQAIAETERWPPQAIKQRSITLADQLLAPWDLKLIKN